MSDGALRAAVSLPGRDGEQHGWITLVARDGAENAAYVSPQPAAEPDLHPNPSPSRSRSPSPSPNPYPNPNLNTLTLTLALTLTLTR